MEETTNYARQLSESGFSEWHDSQDKRGRKAKIGVLSVLGDKQQKMDKKTEKKKRTLPKKDIPAILHVCGEESDPNLQDVPHRDIPKYLREQYWIKQWSSTNRWPHHGISVSSCTKLRLADLDRKLDDPGDAFFDLYLCNLRSTVHARTWVEVTEVFLPKHALKVNRFVREYNGLQGKGQIEATEFLRSLNLDPPDARFQREMADQVTAAIEKKAQKGRDGGSYQSLVRDYGRGALIVGLPIWFATLPADPTDPTTVLIDFATRLNFGIKTIKRSVLRTNWCPFDSVVVLWNPPLESIIDSCTKAPDPNFYSDPANLSWQNPVSWTKAESFFRKLDLLTPSSPNCYVQWNRYSSLDAMLADQRRRFRFFNQPRPLGPKACLEVSREDVGTSLRMTSYTWLFQLWLFVRLHGWRGFRRWVFARFSIPRLYSRLRLSCRKRKLYRSS